MKEEIYISEDILKEIDENENNEQEKQNENIEQKLENKDEQNIVNNNEEINEPLAYNLQENKVIEENKKVEDSNIKENKDGVEHVNNDLNKEENNKQDENKAEESDKPLEENKEKKIGEENNDNGGNNVIEEEKLDSINEDKNIKKTEEQKENQNKKDENILNVNKNENDNKININENKEEGKENMTIKRNLFDLEEYDKSIKVIVLGDSSVGKSSLIHRLIKNEFIDLPATLSLEYHTYIISVNEYSIRMQIWDTAGQEKFDSIVNNYYKSTEVGIFLYSIEKEESFNNIKKWFNDLKENIGENSLNILLGNKSDLEEEKRAVTFNQGEDFSKQNGFHLFKEISCKSNDRDEVEKIMKVFDEIGRHFYEFYKSRRNASSSVDMNYVATQSMIAIGEKQRSKQNKTDKKKCCH